MFVLSAGTASELQRLIGETPGGGVGGQRGSASRQLAFVRCITWTTTGPTANTGTCVVTEYNAASSTWADYGTSSATVLLSAQATALETGKRYLAVRYGQTPDNKTVFVAFPSANVPYYYAGCGVKIESGTAGNKISVDLDNIKGQGLKVFTGMTGSCPTLGIEPGCHITLEGGEKVGVLVDGLAGCGLTASGTPCKSLRVDNTAIAGNGLIPGSGCSLDVNPGCGIQVVADQVRVNRADLMGAGLYPGAGTCALAVYPGCGIKIDGGKVAVDLDNIKGQGLKVFPGTGGACPTIGIDPGCGITLEGGAKVGVQNSDLAGCGLKAGAGCKLDIDTTPAGSYVFSAVTAVGLGSSSGCGLSLTVAVTPFELRTNSCGVVIGFTAGTPNIITTAASIDVTKCANLCTYCTGYQTYGTGGTPGTPGTNCWDGTKWVACVSVDVPLLMMAPPVI